MCGVERFAVALTLLVCLLAGFAAEPSVAQSVEFRVPEADIIQMIKLTDGSTLVGRITEVGDIDFKFQTDMGEMTVPKVNVREIKEVPSSSIKEGQYWFPNPNRTRLYLGPSGRCLRQGEGYFTDVYLFFPGVAYGFTDNFSIGAGMSLFPGLDADEQLFYLTPKVGVSTGEGLDVAMTALLVKIPDDELIVGVLFGTATMGSDDHSFSLGVGYGFVEDELADKPAVMIGGETRVARRVALVSENWVFPGVDKPLISYGVRFFDESLTADLALFNVLSDDAVFPGIPYVGFVWNF